MQLSILYIVYLSFFISCNEIANDNRKILNTDSIFINWNKATLHSFAKQVELTNDSNRKEEYKNRELSFKSFVDIEKEDDVKTSSIRYQFLKEVLKDTTIPNEFYIIEANRSGEQIEIRNYVIYPITDQSANLKVYNFVGHKWVKSSITEMADFAMNESLKNYRAKFSFGVNQDDVIITKIVNDKIDESEFYLYTTLLNVSNIKEVLSIK